MHLNMEVMFASISEKGVRDYLGLETEQRRAACLYRRNAKRLSPPPPLLFGEKKIKNDREKKLSLASG